MLLGISCPVIARIAEPRVKGIVGRVQWDHGSTAPLQSRPAWAGDYSDALDHRLGPGDVSFEAKRFRHRVIAIHQLAVGDVVATGPGQQRVHQ
jgi:hypothetical protein